MRKIIRLFIFLACLTGIAFAKVSTNQNGIVKCPPVNTIEFNGTFGTIDLINKTRDLTTPLSPPYTYGGSGMNSLNPAATYAVTSHLWSDNIHSGTGSWDNFYGQTTGDDTDAFLAVNRSASQATLYTENLTLEPNTAYLLFFHAINAGTYVGKSNPVNIEIRFYDGITNQLISSIQSEDLYPTQKNTGAKITRDHWHQTSGIVNTGTSKNYRIEVVNTSRDFHDNDFVVNNIRVQPLNGLDTDGDGILNNVDLDDDNDGISDIDENACTPSSGVNPYLRWDVDTSPSPGALEVNPIGSAINANESTISFGDGFVVNNTTGINAHWYFTGASATSYAQALTKNQYLQIIIPMAADKSNRIYEITNWGTSRESARQVLAKNLVIAISENAAFSNPILLYDGITPGGSNGFHTTPLTIPFRLQRGTTYFVRVYLFGPRTWFDFDSFNFNAICYTDTDGDGIPDKEDTDSDGDGCDDATEYYNSKKIAGSDHRYGDPATRKVDANGKVIGASYNTTHYNNVTTIGESITITSQPANRIINVNESTSYVIGGNTTAGTLSHQWQVSTDNGSTFSDIQNGGNYSGVTTAQLDIKNISKAMNIYRYRVKIVNQNNICQEIDSEPALLDVKPITKNDVGCYTAHKAKEIAVLSNDNDGDDPVVLKVVITTAGVSADGKTIIVADEGTWKVNNTGTITFTPQTGFTGNPKIISYNVQDNEGNTSDTAATITLTVTPQPNVNVNGSNPKSF